MTETQPLWRRIAAAMPRAAFAFALLCLLILPMVPSGQAQTFSVLHDFTGFDGSDPEAGLTIDGEGNFYGIASRGGYFGDFCARNRGCGTVFKMTHDGSDWVFQTLYVFQSQSKAMRSEAASPFGRVTLRPDGTLYGTSYYGGWEVCNGGCGTVYRLTPPTVCSTLQCLWTESLIFPFNQADGTYPMGDLAFDQAGNIYGTTFFGGISDQGTAYEITDSENGWTQTELLRFGAGPKPGGARPYKAGLIFDQAGNLYGTTDEGGKYRQGTVFQIVPSGRGWTEITLHDFTAGYDGGGLHSDLVMDSAGNMYGANSNGGMWGYGNVYELSPSANGWVFNVVYSFVPPSGGPAASLIFDPAGNLYGTNTAGNGAVFKLSPGQSGWTYTELHTFSGSDGSYPLGSLVMDSHGNLFGTASDGGKYGFGTIFELTP